MSGATLHPHHHHHQHFMPQKAPINRTTFSHSFLVKFILVMLALLMVRYLALLFFGDLEYSTANKHIIEIPGMSLLNGNATVIALPVMTLLSGFLEFLSHHPIPAPEKPHPREGILTIIDTSSLTKPKDPNVPVALSTVSFGTTSTASVTTVASTSISTTAVEAAPIQSKPRDPFAPDPNRKKHHKAISATSANDKIAEIFIQSDFDASNCPTESWVEEMRRADPGIDKVFVDVGFNKGYSFAKWLTLWVPWVNVTVVNWHNAMTQVLNRTDDYLCGNCADCSDTPFELGHRPNPYTKDTKEKLIMIGIEININNLKVMGNIINTIAETNPSLRENRHLFDLQTYQYAVLHESSEVYVRKCQVGYETCHIYSPSRHRQGEDMGFYDKIEQHPLDTLLTKQLKEKINHHRPSRLISFENKSYNLTEIVDILLIDAEGYDPLILLGTKQLINEGKVRMVIFENNDWCPWPNFKLETIVRNFDEAGYDCYYMGTYHVWKLTGQWSSLYEVRRWTNVMCIKRTDVWAMVVERYKVTPQIAASKMYHMKEKRFKTSEEMQFYVDKLNHNRNCSTEYIQYAS